MTARATKVTAQLDEAAAEIVATYGSVRRQLDEWAAGFKASVIGASPPTGGGTPTDPDEVRVIMTAVEALASSGAGAIPKLAALDSQLTWCAVQGRKMWAEVDCAAIPDPATTDAARLAVMMWAVRRAQRDPEAISIGRLERYLHSVLRLLDQCRRWAPAPEPKPQDQCHTHAAARSSALIDPRYRKSQQCRWCGDFHKIHGVHPTPALVRDHDRGIKMSAVRLRAEGIRGVA